MGVFPVTLELREWLVVAGSVGLLLGTFGPW
jgi:hypothetical protein